MSDGDLAAVRAAVAADYPELEIRAEITLRDKTGPRTCLVVTGPATEALVSSVSDLARWFGSRRVVPAPTAEATRPGWLF